MRRRAVLTIASSLGVITAGCLESDSCRGVALAIELDSVEEVKAGDALDFETKELSKQERLVLSRGTSERVRGCTRDEIPGLRGVVRRIAEHTGEKERLRDDLDGRFSTPVIFEDDPYQATVIFDNAEASGGPLGA